MAGPKKLRKLVSIAAGWWGTPAVSRATERGREIQREETRGELRGMTRRVLCGLAHERADESRVQSAGLELGGEGRAGSAVGTVCD